MESGPKTQSRAQEPDTLKNTYKEQQKLYQIILNTKRLPLTQVEETQRGASSEVEALLEEQLDLRARLAESTAAHDAAAAEMEVCSRGGAFSYERGTPVSPAYLQNSSQQEAISPREG